MCVFIVVGHRFGFLIENFCVRSYVESADVDLDVLLGELCALESQLNDGPASRCYKMSTKITISSSSTNNNNKPSIKCFNNYNVGGGDHNLLESSSQLTKMVRFRSFFRGN